MFLGIDEENDLTPEWIYHKSPAKLKHGSNLQIVAWIHSHVRGVGCNLSSIDVHTHYFFSEICGMAGLLAMVFQVTDEDKVKTYDAFTLNTIGIQKFILTYVKNFLEI